MEMIPVDQRRVAFVTPRFRVEMQTEHKIRIQLRIHEFRAMPYLTAAVKEDFALPAHGLVFDRVVRSIEILPRNSVPLARKTARAACP